MNYFCGGLFPTLCLLKVKTEAREVKRRGKYNKDKAGNLGKLGRKAMKEVKVDQVIVKKQTLNVNFFGEMFCCY